MTTDMWIVFGILGILLVPIVITVVIGIIRYVVPKWRHEDEREVRHEELLDAESA